MLSSNPIHEVIKEFRTAKGISRKEMAEKLNITVSGYSQIERGEVDITLSRIYEIAHIFQISSSVLLNRMDQDMRAMAIQVMKRYSIFELLEIAMEERIEKHF